MLPDDHKRYNPFGTWITEKAGCKVQKITLNAGFTCPNRDGTVGKGGCTYCNNQTFNPAFCDNGLSVTEQLEKGKGFFARKYPEMKYLAYFQAYTNTYAELEVLKAKYEEALKVDGVVGLVIATRPDCMPEPLLDYLEGLNSRCLLIVEYGVESTDDEVLRHINRGHDFLCAAQAIAKTAERGIATGAHLILGLPGTHQIEGYVEKEAGRMSQLPVTTMKIHQLQIIKNTPMAEEYQLHTERFHRFTVDEYIDEVIRFVECSRPDIVFERFVSQSPAQLLAVPGWGLKNYQFTERVNRRMDELNAQQGRLWKQK